MKIIFMGTPEFAVPALQKLIESGHEIAAVYTRPPAPAGRGKNERKSPIQQLAERYGLLVKTPVSLKGEAEQKEFREINADAALVAAYGLLLPEAILTAAKYGCVNIHPSLLPRWRGAAPIQHAIIEGDKETGVCIMQMDKGLDTGDVLAVRKYPIPGKMTAGKLHDELAVIGAELALKTIEKLPNVKPVKQSQDGVIYAKKITREDERINWRLSAGKIECLIRGLQPRPGAFFIYNGERIKIIAADFAAPHPPSCHPRESGDPYSGSVIIDSRLRGNDNPPVPGTVLGENLTIACGSGVLKPLKLQRSGKNVVSVQDFLRGFQIKSGEVLE